MYGFSNWAEVADYVGTKSKSQCIDHYNAVYMNSPCYPLPVSFVHLDTLSMSFLISCIVGL